MVISHSLEEYLFTQFLIHEASFQIINIYSINCQNRASELLWH